MDQQEKIDTILKTAAVRQAATGSEFQPVYSAEHQDTLLLHQVEQQLSKQGVKLIVDNLEVKLTSLNNPDAAPVDSQGQPITLQTIVRKSLEGSSFGQYPGQQKSLETEPVYNPATGATTWTDANGIRHSEVGNSTYFTRPYQPRQDYEAEAKAKLKEYGIE